MPENNNIMSLEGQLVGLPLAGPESFSQQQLDYLARALGVDETVLWESNNADGTAPSGFPLTLSESPANFDIVRFYYRPWTTNNCVVDKMGNQSVFMLEASWLNTAQSAAPYSFLDVLTLSGTSLAFTRGCFNQWSQTTVTEDTGYFRIYKIVGVGRIAGGN